MVKYMILIFTLHNFFINQFFKKHVHKEPPYTFRHVYLTISLPMMIYFTIELYKIKNHTIAI